MNTLEFTFAYFKWRIILLLVIYILVFKPTGCFNDIEEHPVVFKLYNENNRSKFIEVNTDELYIDFGKSTQYFNTYDNMMSYINENYKNYKMLENGKK